MQVADKQKPIRKDCKALKNLPLPVKLFVAFALPSLLLYFYTLR